jgi:hypothetical protein
VLFGIWAPAPETSPHGGVKVLWKLRTELEARGQEVIMWTGGEQPACDVLILPERSAPPAAHPKLVRWALFTGGDTNGRTYTWSPLFAEAPQLTVPQYDITELFDAGLPRRGIATWPGKGAGPDGDYRITRDIPRAELIRILQTSELLISYDPFTAVNLEAALCGTPVHVPKNRPPIRDGDDPGIRWADTDNTHRIGEARPLVERLNQEAATSITAFIDDMHNW